MRDRRPERAVRPSHSLIYDFFKEGPSVRRRAIDGKASCQCDRDTAEEAEVRRLANELYERARLEWAISGETR